MEKINYDKEYKIIDVEIFLLKCGFDIKLIANSKKREKIIPYNDFNDVEDYIGCYTKVENDKLIDYCITIPEVKDINSALVCVHEKIHALKLEANINKKYYQELEDESLPMFFERVFVLTRKDKCLLKKYMDFYKAYAFNCPNNCYGAFLDQSRLKMNYDINPKYFVETLVNRISK